MNEQEIEVQPTWFLALRFWWAFMWRLFVFNGIIVFFYMQAFHWFGGKNDILDQTLIAISALVFLALEIWLVRSLLSKRFGPFRITVLAVKPLGE